MQRDARPRGHGAGDIDAGAPGIPLGQLTPSVRQRPDLPQDATGAVVKGVAANSPAAELDVQPGDVILSIDQQPATSPQDAAIKLKTAANKGHVLLLINRDGNPEFLALSTGTDRAPPPGAAIPDRG